MRLEGKRAVVTGGASGIGAAIARRLAAEGAAVIIADLNEDGAREVAGEIDAEAVALDVADHEAVARVLGDVERVDILVNNAGTDDFAFFTQITPDRWRSEEHTSELQ